MGMQTRKNLEHIYLTVKTPCHVNLRGIIYFGRHSHM